MGAACGKNKAKQPKRADPQELEEKARKEAEDKAAAEAAAREAEERAKAEAEAAAAAEAKAKEEEERARAEAEAAAAAAAEAEAAEKARREEEEAARRQQEEEERRAAEAREQAQVPQVVAEPAEKELEQATVLPTPSQEEPEYPEKEKQIPAEDGASEATMETSRQVRKVSEPEYGAAQGGRKARTVTPCDMTAVDETSMYVSKRCGCDIGSGHDENACPICQSIDLSDAPLLN